MNPLKRKNSPLKCQIRHWLKPKRRQSYRFLQRQKMTQRVDDLHENLVRSGFIWEPWHYKYSSAINYYTN